MYDYDDNDKDKKSNNNSHIKGNGTSYKNDAYGNDRPNNEKDNYDNHNNITVIIMIMAMIRTKVIKMII